MKINPTKTKLLCISPATTADVSSYIQYEGEEIKSVPELKVLGFRLGSRLTVELHIDKTMQKLRMRLWSLRTLKFSGMEPEDLVFVYKSIIRPILNYAVLTYNSLLTAG